MKYTRIKSIDKKIKEILLALIPFVFVLVTWWLFYKYNVVPRWLITSPFDTAKTFVSLIADGTVFELIAVSALNAVPAFILALVVAIVLGTLIGISKTANKIFSPFLSAIYPIPSLAWLPLIILFMGFTRETIWVVIFISSFMRIIYNVIGGVRNVNINWIFAAKNLGLNKIDIIIQIVIPGAFPQIMTGIRLGFGSSWRSMIGAEMLAVSAGGLGRFIWTAQWFFQFDKVIIGIIIIGFIGVFIELFVFKQLEKITLIKWGMIHE